MDLQLIGTKINTAIYTIINALVPNQSGNAGKFLTTNGTNTSWATVSGGGPTITTQTTLGIDCNSADIFIVNLSGNATFDLSNVTAGKSYEFIVKNTTASAITVSIPSNAVNVFAESSLLIEAGKARRFYVSAYSNKYYWDVSKGLINA